MVHIRIPGDLNLPWKKAGNLGTVASFTIHCCNEHQQHTTCYGKQTSAEYHQQSNPQLSNLGTFRFIPPCYMCQSISHFNRHQAETKRKYKNENCYKEGLNLGKCRMWCSSGICAGSTPVSHLH